MRKLFRILMIIGALGFTASMTSCKDETAGDAVDNAMEETGDAIEEAGDATEDAADDAGDALRDATE